jgi:hypothetical protein
VFALSAPIGAPAGTPVDPNLDDHVFGTTGGIRYASESKPFDIVNGYANAVVGCGGPRWHLIGGGSTSGGPVAQAWQSASRPDDYNDADTRGDDGWYAGAHGAASAELTAYSICIRDGVIRYPTKTVANSPSGLRTASVGCGGAKWHATSGSAFIATTGSWVNSSFPMDGGDPKSTPDDGWTGSVYDFIGGAGGFYIYAVCAQGLDLRYVKRLPVSLSAGQAVLRRADCKETEHVVGGGARVTGPANRSRLVSTIPFDDADADAIPDDGWQSRAYGVSGANKNVTAFAICLG